MANTEWLEIFRVWPPEKLASHVGKLEEQIEVFSSQQIGSKSYVKDLGELRGALSAAARVVKERTRPNPGAGIIDFSNITFRR